MITKLIRRVSNLFLQQDPGTTVDVESWMEATAVQRITRLEVIREFGEVQEFAPSKPACEGAGVVNFQPVIGTFRRYDARIPFGMIVAPNAFTVMPDGVFLTQPA